MGFTETLEQKIGRGNYVNSGVVKTRDLDLEKLDFQVIGEGFDGFMGVSPKVSATWLNMPKDCFNLGPHTHPGGEISYVSEGEYFDAAMDGSVIQCYPAGSVVFYNKWSTHRPLSNEGAKIFYFTFDGIIIPNRGIMAPDSSLKIARKMAELKTPEDAVDYGLRFLFSEDRERQRVMDELFSPLFRR